MAQSIKTNNFSLGQRFSKLGLKNKATILAIAIGTIPVVAIGLFGYLTVSQSLTGQALERNKTKTLQVSDKINRFMFERFGDIQTLATFDLFTDPSLKVSTTQKAASLERFIKTYGVYNNITVANLDGSTSFGNTNSDTPKGFSFKELDYFIAVSKNNQPVIGFPRLSKITKKFSLFAAAPIKINGSTNAVIRTRIPIGKLDNILKDFVIAGDDYYIADSKGRVFSTSDNEASDKVISEVFPILGTQPPTSDPVVNFHDFDHLIGGFNQNEEVIAYVTSTTLDGLPNLNWTIVVTTPTSVALAAQRNLLILIIIGTFITIVLVAIIATWLVNRATKPITEAAEAVGKIGLGQLKTRLVVTGEDELAVLGNNINLMTEQLEILQKEQELEVQRVEQARQEARSEADAGAEVQKQEKEKLQASALRLLMEVDPISKGDLTIRARVTDDEIGTLADSYNSTVQSLRQIVVQVQATAQQVVDTTSFNEPLVKSLSQAALRQAEDMAIALTRIQEMALSIQTVSDNAQTAEDLVEKAAITLEAGDVAMNRTVDGILTIRNTVSETSEKVKRLGEASQNISRVVKLISGFAEQTNLLALTASIEAARAGAQGRGFAVVADEIQVLAQQSAEATAEITDLVAEIQLGTSDVGLAMAAGTIQVDIGTKLVEEARANLTEIAIASVEINNLVEAISQATVTQSQSSEIVKDTITDVAAIAAQTSTDSNQVSNAFKDLLEVAQKLQISMGQFKV